MKKEQRIYRLVKDLHLDPANVRKHGDKNVKAIEASFKRFGQQTPIVER